ncbi:MAG TPA: TIGR03663 family protein, partial [Anaerolineae bacterium]|nr:TIGR03663 family protein [Anaerolineae bacterium]
MPSLLDRPLSSLLALNWEMALYGLFIVIAIATRFWDLGSRAMSHDESLHAVYSWKLYAGEGYQHNPMMHGPFLFHANALIYFLFGDSDYTARIVPALFGVILVALPTFLRKWLGRTGALVTSGLILISPSLLYYSRYIRNDIYIAVWTMLMAIALFKYLEERENRWLYLGATAVVLSLASKEVTYIHGFIGVTFLGAAILWETLASPGLSRDEGSVEPSVSGRTKQALALGGFIVGILLLYLRLALGPAIPSLLVLAGGLLMAIALIAPLIERRGPETTLSALRGIGLQPLGICAAIFAVIFVLLFTTFFTNPQGLVTGMVGSITYWLSQHPVQRGGQPWFYYLVLLPLYEFTPLLFSLAGMGYYLTRGEARLRRDGDALADRLFLPFLLYWWVTALVIYSWAGEKMPWLLVHLALPLCLLAGRFIGDVLEAADWGEIRRRGGVLLALLLVPTALALIVWVRLRPFRGLSLQRLGETMQWLAGLLVLTILLWALLRTAQQLGARHTGHVLFAAVLGVLCLLTVRHSWMANYINDETAKEFIVYAHATPDVKIVMQEIEDLSERLVGDREIKIAYDDQVTWPFEWYLRNYDNKFYFVGSPGAPLDAPVVLIGTENENKVKPYLGDNYTRREYKMIWWPIEEYKGLTPQRIVNNLRDPALRQDLWNIVFRRKYKHPLSQWPYVDRFVLYVRKDVVTKIWAYGAAAPELAAVEDEYEKRRLQVASLAAWGMQGSGPGQMVNPKDLALDAEGNIYVVDSGNHRVVKFDAAGNFLTQWGGQGSGPGQFKDDPWGIGVDSERGWVYVADTWNHRIQKFDLEGNVIAQWGTFVDTGGMATGEAGKFWGPRDIAIDAEGNLYVTDTGNKRVQKFTPDGEFLGQWGGAGFAPGQFSEPVGIAISPVSGDIFVADTWNRRIQRFDRDFKPLVQWPVRAWEGESVNNKPYLALDAQDNVYVTDPEGYRVLVFDNQGNLLAVFGQFGADASSFNLPTGIALDAEGNIYVA